MPTFCYMARDAAAQVRKGVEEAASAAAVVAILRNRGWLVIDVRPGAAASGAPYRPLPWFFALAGLLIIVIARQEKGNGQFFGLLGAPMLAYGLAALLAPRMPPRSVDIELSFLQLAIMIRSGLTLLTALRTLAEQANRATMRQIWATIGDAIQQGSGLGDAMAKHHCFPVMSIQLIRVGEKTGTLEPVLSRAAESLERRRQLRTHLLTAMAYPAIVFVVAIGVVVFMLLYIIPKLTVVLNSLGRKLPAITQALLDTSAFVQNYLLGIVGGIVVLTAGIVTLYVTRGGRLFIDRLMLRLPILGHVLQLSATVQFSYAMATLLRSGVTLTEALGTVSSLHANRYAGQKVAAAQDAVNRGGTLADQLTDRRVYKPMLPRMVVVGESSGTLDEVLDEVARFHESQLQVTIRRLSVLLEPAVVVVVGSIVGFVYIAFFMALFAVSGGGK